MPYEKAFASAVNKLYTKLSIYYKILLMLNSWKWFDCFIFFFFWYSFLLTFFYSKLNFMLCAVSNELWRNLPHRNSYVLQQNVLFLEESIAVTMANQLFGLKTNFELVYILHKSLWGLHFTPHGPNILAWTSKKKYGLKTLQIFNLLTSQPHVANNDLIKTETALPIF